MTKKPASSNPALNMRMACVLGWISCQAKVQNAASMANRKIEDRVLNIYVLYPILTPPVKHNVAQFDIHGPVKRAVIAYCEQL
ncbi:MAG TPA: hypothetical protein VMW23_00860 [Sedimentisphaerales bacterium]|nr:hypothetical protein [Sedimentisphaerales bacterium]